MATEEEERGGRIKDHSWGFQLGRLGKWADGLGGLSRRSPTRGARASQALVGFGHAEPAAAPIRFLSIRLTQANVYGPVRQRAGGHP